MGGWVGGYGWVGGVSGVGGIGGVGGVGEGRGSTVSGWSLRDISIS